jgi:ribonuclease BN (tRNA processing enzyme)
MGVVVSSALFGRHEILLRRQEARLSKTLQAKEAEQVGSQEATERVRQFEIAKSRLEHQIGVINELRRRDLDPLNFFEAIRAPNHETLEIVTVQFLRGRIRVWVRSGDSMTAARYAERLQQTPRISRVVLLRPKESDHPDELLIQGRWEAKE